MAANFWQSTHRQQWMLTREELLINRKVDREYLVDEDYRKLQFFFANLVQAIGEQLKLRQQVIATATVYMKRVYAKHSLKCIDPLLLAPTAIYLASKVEECGMIPNTRLLAGCLSAIKTKYSFAFTYAEYPYSFYEIQECEFVLMELMACCLIVYHPYRSLLRFASENGLDSLLPFAWRVVNDSLRGDFCLLHPPHLIALAALYLSFVTQKQDSEVYTAFFAEVQADLDAMLSVVWGLLVLYRELQNFDERQELVALWNRMPKPVRAPR